MSGNRRIQCIVLTFLLCFVVSACRKRDVQSNVPIQELVTEYVEENLTCFTVTENGIVYTIGLSDETSSYFIHSYDESGTVDESYALPNDYSMIQTVTVSKEKQLVYFTGQGNSENISLFVWNQEVNTIEKLYDFTYFDSVKQMLLIENKIYILGLKPYSNMENIQESSGYTYSGEVLVYYDMDSGDVYQLGIDMPISMTSSEAGTLVIQVYLKAEGYCFIEYNHNKNSFQTMHTLEKNKFNYFALCNEGESVIYTYSKNSRGLVLSDCSNLEAEVELYADASSYTTGIFYVNDKVYFMNGRRNVVSFPLSEVQRENKEIRFVSTEYGMLDAPYGCGYSMKRTEMDLEKFSLKVLAQDPDYDLCIIDAMYSGSDNLKENGVFYPLNDVPGIYEYLEECFPYVREVATKEDGTIWMLPVTVDIPGLIVNKDKVLELGISVKDQMTYKEFADMIRGIPTKDRERLGILSKSLEVCFFWQYFGHYTSVENEMFAQTLPILRQLGQVLPESPGGRREDYIVDYGRSEGFYVNLLSQQNLTSGNTVVNSIPKLSSEDKNTGTCTFLAVNPNSSRIDETLAYLADWITYQMTEEEKPLFFQEINPDAGALELSIYELYRDGELVFSIDSDVYEEGFDEMLQGNKSLAEYMKETQQRLMKYFNE